MTRLGNNLRLANQIWLATFFFSSSLISVLHYLLAFQFYINGSVLLNKQFWTPILTNFFLNLDFFFFLLFWKWITVHFKCTFLKSFKSFKKCNSMTNSDIFKDGYIVHPTLPAYITNHSCVTVYIITNEVIHTITQLYIKVIYSG